MITKGNKYTTVSDCCKPIHRFGEFCRRCKIIEFHSQRDKQLFPACVECLIDIELKATSNLKLRHMRFHPFIVNSSN